MNLGGMSASHIKILPRAVPRKQAPLPFQPYEVSKVTKAANAFAPHNMIGPKDVVLNPTFMAHIIDIVSQRYANIGETS